MRPTGPIPAAIMIVGEAPSREEDQHGVPFIGQSGRLLDDLLHKAGIMRTSCFATNVCRHLPPKNIKGEPDISLWMSDNKKSPDPSWVQLGIDGRWVHPHIRDGYEQLQREIAHVQPTIVLALGNTALWALTGYSGIQNWRGSRLSPSHLSCTVVPSLNPASVLRQMEQLPVLQMDLVRARLILEGKQTPRHYGFQVAPSYVETIERLDWLLRQADAHSSDSPLRLAGDIETRAAHIACWGVAWSETEAICVPILQANSGSPFYWTSEQEAEIVHRIWRLHQHSSIVWDGQNYLYDCQYYARFNWGIPKRVYDTMIGHHAIYSSMRKGLAFLSSMYAHDHVFWKDESKDWDPHLGEKQLWTYNCKDACITWEVGREIRAERVKVGLGDHADFQQRLFFPVLRMMQRGVRLDYPKRAKLRGELINAALERQTLLDWMVGHPLNPKSPKKLLEFFYNDMRVPGVKHIKTDKLTSDSAALEQITNREPLLLPVCQTIAELRSIGVFLSTFIEAQPDVDGRMRSSFAVAGPTTYRFASYENAFGSGLNFQNLPEKEKQKLTKARDYISLPNIRSLFLPDPGMTFFDMDLDRADLQVVVWEADDADLKLALREGLDMHIFNAMAVFGFDVPIDELKEVHPNYPEHKKRYGKQRQLAKAAVHATNYGVGDRKLAITLGITVMEASRFRTKWFAAHPGIGRWHKRTEEMARRLGYIENKFGARLYILGRFDLPEALGWTPQSTVAGVINRALVNIDEAQQRGETNIELLLQVHDSLAGQFPTVEKEQALATLRSLSRIVIPYDDPLIIPVGINTSTLSWGDCK
jgi:DNA polymerase I-like protein with 3'-5' exonuclease and polymerase domains/uracil-DNA glycosylase